MQLLYRGHSYTRTAIHAKAVCHPRAINWRYQLARTVQTDIPSIKLSAASLSVQPRAINWRYQIPTGG
mgnify:CR=1 FL=1